MKEMSTFSFRAECEADVSMFNLECQKAGFEFDMSCKPDVDLPDVVVEIKAEASLECLRDLMRKVEDGHVMLQTLRESPLATNSLERDYDLH